MTREQGGMDLNGGGAWMLTATERRQAVRRTEEEAVEALCALADTDTVYAPAARKAMECVENYSADARMLCLLIERAMDGWFRPPELRGNAKKKGATA